MRGSTCASPVCGPASEQSPLEMKLKCRRHDGGNCHHALHGPLLRRPSHTLINPGRTSTYDKNRIQRAAVENLIPASSTRGFSRRDCWQISRRPVNLSRSSSTSSPRLRFSSPSPVDNSYRAVCPGSLEHLASQKSHGQPGCSFAERFCDGIALHQKRNWESGVHGFRATACSNQESGQLNTCAAPTNNMWTGG